MATQVQLQFFLGGKSHGHPDVKREREKKNNKVESFSMLFFMSTLTWIPEKELERVIENTREGERWKKTAVKK